MLQSSEAAACGSVLSSFPLSPSSRNRFPHRSLSSVTSLIFEFILCIRGSTWIYYDAMNTPNGEITTAHIPTYDPDCGLLDVGFCVYYFIIL